MTDQKRVIKIRAFEKTKNIEGKNEEQLKAIKD